MTQSATFAFAMMLLTAAPGFSAEPTPTAVTTVFARPTYRTPTREARERADRYLRSGLGFLNGGQPERAVEELQRSVRAAPGPENFKALGTAYDQAGKGLKAAWAYRESLHLAPDTGVQSLLDSLEERMNGAAEARYRRLLDQAPEKAQAGDAATALQDYVDAYRIKPGPESRGAGLNLAADSMEGDLARADLVQAVETLCLVEPLRHAQAGGGYGDTLVEPQARLDRAEARVARWTGMSLGDNQKNMVADHEDWARSTRAKAAAGEGGL